MNSKTQTVLVTGGAGYIGTTLIGQLLARGYNVHTIDSLTFGGQGLLGYVPRANFQFFSGDICVADDVRKAMDGVDAVIHLAAIVGDPACAKEPERATRVNRDGSERLLEIALEKKVQRFLFASTCSNYGKMDDRFGLLDETSPLSPVSLYAELKVGFEQTLMNLDRKGFVPVCLRFATAYGLSPRPRFDLTVNEFTRDLTMGRKVEIYGEQFWRPYAHVVDLARAMVMALEAKPEIVAKRAFNVGDITENFQKRTLIEMIIRQLPEASELVSYVHRDEDPRDYRVRFDRIRDELGFAITRTVVDGIAEVKGAIQSGMIKDPDNPMFRNI